MIRQYIIKNAYKGNDEVITFENGNKTGSKIVAEYNIDGYCDALENMDYERAYDVDYYKAELEKAKAQVEYWEFMYSFVSQYPLYKKERY